MFGDVLSVLDQFVTNRLSTISSVGTSPAQAMTTSGSLPISLLAHSQMPMPDVQCLIAASIFSDCGEGCLPATITLTLLRLVRQ